MKIRLEGLPEENQKFIQDFKEGLKGKYEVLEVSKDYQNRQSKLVRTYVTIKIVNN